MTIRPSEIQITKVSDASSTPLLFSEDAFVFDGAKAGGDVFTERKGSLAFDGDVIVVV